MKLIITFLTLTVTAFTAMAADQPHWATAVKALGLATDSNEFRTIVAAFGSISRSQSGKTELIGYKASGITFKSEGGRVVEVQMQIAPGKAINDVGYSGELPTNVKSVKDCPGDAIRILGPPLNDLRNGDRELKYLVNENIMTLHYRPQLDYVTFTKEKEPNKMLR